MRERRLISQPPTLALLVGIGALRTLLNFVYFLADLYFQSDGLSLFGFGNDDGSYYRLVALRVAEGFDTSAVNPFPTTVGLLMRITGAESLYPYKWLANSFATAAILFAANRAARTSRYNKNVALCVGLGLALHPTLLIYSNNSFIRDVWIIHLFLVGSLCLAESISPSRGRNNWRYYNGTVALICFTTVGALRPYAAGSVLVALPTLAILSTLVRRANSGVRRHVALVLIGLTGIIGMVLIRPILAPLLSLRATAYSIGNSRMGIDLQNAGTLAFPLRLIYSFACNALGPMIWQVRSPQLAISFAIDAVPSLLTAFVILKNRRGWTVQIQVLLAISVTYLALISIFNDNLGAATRLRLPATSILLIVAGKLFCEARAAGRVSGSIVNTQAIICDWRGTCEVQLEGHWRPR